MAYLFSPLQTQSDPTNFVPAIPTTPLHSMSDNMDTDESSCATVSCNSIPSLSMPPHRPPAMSAFGMVPSSPSTSAFSPSFGSFNGGGNASPLTAASPKHRLSPTDGMSVRARIHTCRALGTDPFKKRRMPFKPELRPVAPSPAALSPSMETRALPGPSGASGDSPNQLQKLQVDMPAQYRNRARVRRDSVCATDTLLMPPPANLCRAVSAPQQQLDSADVSSMEHEDDASSPAVSSISLSTSYGSMDSAMLDVSGLEDSKFSPWSIHSADPVSQCSQTSSSSSMSAGPYHPIARHAVHPAVLQLAHPQPQSNYPVLPQLPEVSSKPADDLAFIQMHVFDHVMFRDLTSFQKRAIFEALRQVKVQAGHYVCRQGEIGDAFYLIVSGTLEAWKSSGSTGFQRKVYDFKRNESFGDTALMHNYVRSASVKARTDCVLWELKGQTYRSILMSSRQFVAKFVQDCEFLRILSEEQRNTVVEWLDIVDFKAGDCIIQQGTEGQHFFLLHTGQCVVKQQIGPHETTLAVLQPGSYFGEVSLICQQPRCASVIAATPVRCLVMSKKTFLDRFLAMKEAGPLLNQALISHAFKTYQNVARASEMYSATAQQQQQVPGLDRSNSQSSMGSGCGDD